MYKEASKLKLRIATTKGALSVEQLWDLSLEELDSIAVHLEEEYKSSKNSKSFLRKTTKANKVLKLKFSITLDILESKIEERDEAVNATEVKEKEQKLLSILTKKKDEALENMSEADLEKELKKLQGKK